MVLGSQNETKGHSGLSCIAWDISPRPVTPHSMFNSSNGVTKGRRFWGAFSTQHIRKTALGLLTIELLGFHHQARKCETDVSMIDKRQTKPSTSLNFLHGCSRVFMAPFVGRSAKRRGFLHRC